jgi:hypothetical protein
MALVREDLQTKIRAALQSAKDHNWDLDQVAAGWANAIHDYVKEAEVEGVSSSVTVSVPLNVPTPSTGTGTATQTGTVQIK